MTERKTGARSAVVAASDGLARRLQAARGPAFIIAPYTAQLVATNSAGARTLGFAQEPDTIVSLDSAMPAIMDLRRLANSGARTTAGRTRALVFWTDNGMARLECLIEVMEREEGAERLVLVEVAVPRRDNDVVHNLAAEPELPFEGLPISHAAAPSTPPAASTPPPRAPQNNERSDVPTSDRQPSAPRRDHRTAELKSALPHPRSTDGVRMQSGGGQPEKETTASVDHQAANGRRSKPTDPPDGVPNGVRPSQRSEANSRSEQLPRLPIAADVPANTAASAMPPVRTDHDTLKAIARQILAGRTADKPQPSQAADIAPPPPTSAPPAAIEPSTPPRPRKTGGSTTQAIVTTLPVAARGSASDVRRAQPTMPAQQPPSPTVLQPPVAGNSCAAPEQSNRAKPGRSVETAVDDPSRGGTARRALVRRLAHELKTPLSAIATASELMKDERFGPIGDERYLRYARDIHESARHALDVVERMLVAPRDFPGASEMAFTNLDLNEIVTALLSNAENLARDAGVSIKPDLAPRVPLVVADATSVRQILLNLITNALKFTPRHGRITLFTETRADGHLEVGVADTGHGMDADDIAHALGEGAEPRPRPGGGYGIGLPLAKRLAEANGAQLSITSAPKTGTRVSLAFPPSRQIPV